MCVMLLTMKMEMIVIANDAMRCSNAGKNIYRYLYTIIFIIIINSK